MQEDLSAFFGDFAVCFELSSGGSVKGIVDAPFVSVGEGAAVESSAVSLIVKTCDVEDVVHGDIGELDEVEYTVRGIEPDGLGVTVLRLERV
jgi:hypothetical protein